MSFHFDRLKISKIEIENFRQYYDNNIIEFSQDEKKPFTIIKGTNGAGKTNIMNAITWCFYGKEKNLSKDDEDFPTVNLRKYNETKEDGLLRTIITIELSDESGPKYKITRKMTLFLSGKSNNYVRVKEGIIPQQCTPTMETMFHVYDTHKGWDKSLYFDKEVSKILPEDLSSYFLFDGEKLEEFFEQIENIKKGLEDVSKIIVTEKALKHLGVFVVDLRTGIKHLKPETKLIQDQMIVEKKEQESIDNKIKPLKLKMNEVGKKIKDCEEFILQNREVKGLQEREIELKGKIQSKNNEEESIKNRQKQFIIDNFPRVILSDAINDALIGINSKVKKGELPPKIAHTFITDLLNEQKCICGHDVLPHTEEYAKLKKLQNSAVYSKIQNLCNTIKFELSNMLKNEHIVPQLQKFSLKLIELKNQKIKNIHELEEIAVKLKNTKHEEINKKYEEKSSLEKQRKNLEIEYGGLKNQFDLSRKKYDDLETDFDAEIAKETKFKHQNRRIKLCENALEELLKIKNTLLEEVRKKVQLKTQEYFLQLIWKKNTFDEVKIDSEYDIKVHHKDDSWILTALSKGEKLVLALSFMSALRDVTGFQFPLIIDTPLGRVSGEPRNNIAKYLPEFLENQQVTLLMTDSEFNAPIEDTDGKKIFPSFRETIISKMGKEISLQYDEDTRSTTIK